MPQTLLQILQGMADATWAKVNVNQFSDAWPPIPDRTTAGSPASVVGAWSSFGWDSQRGQLMLFGGGHGNYAGNELYLWKASTGEWSLGNLPSKVVGVTLSNQQQVFMPVDFAAPPSMHSYDMNNYLPACDRFLVPGGPAYNASNGPVKADGTNTGPFLWNPALADPSKVGGTDGSGYQASRLGSQSWQNLDRHGQTFKFTWWFGERALNIADGVSATTVESGADVVFFTGGANGGQFLARLVVDPAVPTNNSMRIIGKGNESSGSAWAYGAGSYCSARKWFVALTSNASKPLVVWDCGLAPPPPNATYYPHDFTNLSVNPSFPGGLAGYSCAGTDGIDYDPTTDSWFAWNGYGDVWRLKATGAIGDSWTCERGTVGANLALKPTNLNTYGGGVRGKFKFAAGPNCMLAMDANGDIWAYRQPGYVGATGEAPPPPPPITVTVTPTGASLLTGSTQAFSATVAGSSNQAVSWSVNGIAGGNATLGTVSAAGLYTAPASVPNPATVTLRATAAANGTSFGEASITVSAAEAPPPPPTSTVLTITGSIPGLGNGTLSGTVSNITFTPE